MTQEASSGLRLSWVKLIRHVQKAIVYYERQIEDKLEEVHREEQNDGEKEMSTILERYNLIETLNHLNRAKVVIFEVGTRDELEIRVKAIRKLVRILCRVFIVSWDIDTQISE